MFIEAGINDLLYENDVEDVIHNFIKMLSKIHEQSPSTSVYILSLFPTENVTVNQGVTVKNKVKELNTRLSELCKENSITFVDTYSLFEKDGGLKPEYDCGDGLHLNANGYFLWRDSLRKFVDH